MRVWLFQRSSSFDVTSASPDDTVADLQEALVAECGTPANDQVLLLCSGTRLEGHRTLGYYHLTGDGSEDTLVFLFNQRLLTGSGSGSLSVSGLSPVAVSVSGELETTDYQVPTQPVLPSQPSEAMSVLSKSQSHLIRILPRYLENFAFHLEQSHAFLRGSAKRREVALACVDKQVHQCTAVKAVKSSLLLYSDHLQKRVQAFLESCENQRLEQELLLNNFDGLIARLQEVQLHESLRTPKRNTLLDCVSEQRLRSWKSKCEQCAGDLREKLNEFTQVYTSLQQQMSQEESTPCPYNLEELQLFLDTMERLGQEQHALLPRLQQDHDQLDGLIHSTMEQIKNPDASAGMRSITADAGFMVNMQNLDQQDQDHRNAIIPKFTDIDIQMRQFLERTLASQQRVAAWCQQRLVACASLSTRLRGVEHKMGLFEEIRSRTHSMFSHFFSLQNMPAAYRACLVEIVHRHAYGCQFRDTTEKMMEQLSDLRDQEVARREEFLQSFGQYLPQGLIEGLNERPPHCDLHSKPFDTSLPALDSCVDAEGREVSVAGVVASQAKSSNGNSSGTTTNNDKQETHAETHAEAESGPVDTQAQAQLQLQLQQQLEALRAELDTARTQATAAHSYNATLRQENERLTIELQSRTGQQESWSSVRQQLEESEAELQQQLDTLQHQLDVSQECHQSAMKETSALTEELMQLRDECAQKEAHNSDQEQRLASAHQELEELTTQLKEAQARPELECKLVQTDADATLQRLTAHNAQLESEVHMLKGCLDEASKHQHQAEELALVQASLDSMQSERFQLTTRCESLEQELEDARRQLQDMSVAVEQREQDCTQQRLMQLHRVSQHRTRERERVSNLLTQLKERIRHCEQKNRVEHAKLLSLEEELSRRRNMESELREQLSSVVSAPSLSRDRSEDFQAWKQLAMSRVSLDSVETGDSVLFHATGGDGHYMAVSRNNEMPNRFLSMDCVALLRESAPQLSEFVVGNVVFSARKTAHTLPDGGTSFNLPEQTPYFELMVELAATFACEPDRSDEFEHVPSPRPQPVRPPSQSPSSPSHALSMSMSLSPRPRHRSGNSDSSARSV